MMKKVFSVVVAVLMVFAMMPVIASAASYDHIVGDGETFDISTATDGDTIGVSGAVTLTGTKKVKVFCSEGTTLTIDNLNIDISAMTTACPITFDGTGNTLILKNTSSLIAGYGEPGVKVLSGTALEITGGETDSLSAQGGRDAAGIGGGEFNGAVGTITISGGNVLSTGGENGAGIGAGINMSNGTVKITGGDVEAYGGSHAAGIGGGGDYGSGGTIEISGGVVEASGGIGGAGIGGGYFGSGGSIKISGTADVTGYGGEDSQGVETEGGAGIGGGYSGSGGTINIQGGTAKGYGSKEGAGIGGGSGMGAAVTISGGTVLAEGGSGGSGIGSGEEAASTGSVTISAGSVAAQGGNDGAGIGGGYYSGGGTINISGSADVESTGGLGGAGIGSGGDAGSEGLDSGSITISGGSVTAQGGGGGAGIGSGYETSGGTTQITGGVVTATGGACGAGIGTGDALHHAESGVLNGGSITISGGTVQATGGDFAAGVGGGNCALGGAIIIEGTADVTAAGYGGAGIGGGYGKSAGSVNINSGTVHATGNSIYDAVFDDDCGAAGIGGGIGGDGGVITIIGGEVTALSTEYGAGIGSGDGYPQEETSDYLLSGGVITITGGTVNAAGGYTGAGIGGGYYSDSGNIIISGGTINATGGESGAGIGGGVMGSGGMIDIFGGTVNAVSEGLGAGIGGGEEGYGGIITIWGGTVFALSEEYVKDYSGGSGLESVSRCSDSGTMSLEIDLEPEAAAGIGNGAIIPEALEGFVTERDSSGLISIFGGVVYAGGPEGDIGPGATIQISGGSAVFLKNDLISIDPPSLPDGHVHKTSLDSKDPLVFVDYKVYGIMVNSDWTDATGGYFKLYTLEYDANGGSGSYEMTAAGGPEITLDDGTGFTNSGYVFTGWNTQADSSGTGYNGGAKMQMPLMDTTLFAVWSEDTGGQRGTIGAVLTDSNGDPLPGYTVELHSVVLTRVTDSQGNVSFINVSFEDHTLIIKDGGGTIVATFTLKMTEGSQSGYLINGSEIDVTYTGHTVSIRIDISLDGQEATVEDVVIIDNPDTGSGFNWRIWAAITALLAAAAAVVSRKRLKV